MNYSIIIPARYASSRLPGKPLLEIAGKSILQHVHERACQSQAQRIIIATDDERIESHARGFGAEVVMTSSEHQSGTDRLQEVVSTLAFAESEVVVNVQGDEPLLPAVVIDQVADILLAHPAAGIATLCEPIEDLPGLFNPNIVKVVFDQAGRALYFSRAPIPWCRDEFSADLLNGDTGLQGAVLPAQQFYRHIGIYAYRVGLLNRFVSWPMGQLEALEKLEQLRAMENATPIQVAVSAQPVPGGVDTEADYLALKALLEGADER